jgi:hypothetical protein
MFDSICRDVESDGMTNLTTVIAGGSDDGFESIASEMVAVVCPCISAAPQNLTLGLAENRKRNEL